MDAKGWLENEFHSCSKFYSWPPRRVRNPLLVWKCPGGRFLVHWICDPCIDAQWSAKKFSSCAMFHIFLKCRKAPGTHIPGSFLSVDARAKFFLTMIFSHDWLPRDDWKTNFTRARNFTVEPPGGFWTPFLFENAWEFFFLTTFFLLYIPHRTYHVKMNLVLEVLIQSTICDPFRGAYPPYAPTAKLKKWLFLILIDMQSHSDGQTFRAQLFTVRSSSSQSIYRVLNQQFRVFLDFTTFRCTKFGILLGFYKVHLNKRKNE